MGVGTEILLGQIANTNAQEISRALASIGVNVYRHTAVGDNLDRMRDVLGDALQRSDLVIVTGGLGPTPDDITREAVAAAIGRRLERDPELARAIAAIFDDLGRDMPEENLRQADLPQGARPIPPEGTAPGFVVEHKRSHLYALPGVPWEMKAMLTKVVLPEVQSLAGAGAIVSREVLVVGLGESHTHSKIRDLVQAQTNPTIAFLAGGGRVRVRITARADDEARGVALIEPVEKEVRERLGASAVPGAGVDLAGILADLLTERGLRVAVAESLTGGGLAEELSARPGASDYLAGGLVVYSDDAKRDVAGIDPSLLDRHGAVSAETAAALARRAAETFDAELGLATTGVAGPAEVEGKSVGTIFVGASLHGHAEARAVRGYGDRDNVRGIAVTAALDLGRRVIERS